MAHIFPFTELETTSNDTVGGKATNLGILTRAGFSVPPGFVIDTHAYIRFLKENGIDDDIQQGIASLNFDDPVELEKQTEAIRSAVFNADIPTDLESEIINAYRKLGEGVYVAVRSSGTSEDSEDASSAGLHDTYLEISGVDAVIDAVKRCWASLWTARAVSYRNSQGIDNIGALIAIVVQTMVRSEISGVMFTGNPLTSATDEIVINSSWGLGEAVVSGIVTPDQFVIKSNTLKTKDKILGSKTVQVINHHDGSPGTIEEAVADSDRSRFTLSDEQLRELAAIGRKVQTHYGEFPQDIEWGYANEQFYLLQARPITGVDFAWDTDLENWQTTEDDDDYFWTRGQADEVWTGAITPLMYTWRAPSWDAGSIPASELWGWDDLPKLRYWKYHKGEVYYNAKLEKLILERTLHPALRPYFEGGYTKLPPQWRDEAKAAPLSYFELVKMHARVQLLAPQFYQGFKIHEDYIYNPERFKEARGLEDDEIRALSDSELKKFIDKQCKFEDVYNLDQWTWFFIHARDMICLLGYIVDHWYTGDNKSDAYMDLVSGYSKRTATLEANLELWKLSEQIRHSKKLLAAFNQHQDGEFLKNIESFKDGKAYLANYQQFLKDYGHRGHSDRDIYFPRREEDPGIDYAALKAMLSGPSASPEVAEEALSIRREALIDDVIANLTKRPFGILRAEFFKLVLDWVDRFLMARDNERHFLDHATLSIRRGFLEMNRRMVKRGQFESERDFWFLGREELYELFDGNGNKPLLKVKIAARMKNFDLFDAKDYMPLPFLHRGRELDLDAPDHDGDVLRGLGVARGEVTGIARVTKSLKDIGNVKHGEILIVNATDPGWTPVFGVIKGIVLETGGMTAHGACLAREYGMPAVQLNNALRLIPDGATITVNGGAGEVILVSEADE